ncbi:cupin domain-containing protein [Castellaniella sp.]|uniref:cupin domain-containing protein n=1 Tax=Castellaniella sp. TaxID=1955812 RepID=UPI00355D50CE
MKNDSQSHIHSQHLIQALGLQPHPEGGYYRELYRSRSTLPYRGHSRSTLTAIHYLLGVADHSAWHRIDADEVWSFHAGSVLVLYVWDTASNEMAITQLGDPRIHPGARFQAVVPAGCWFAAELAMRAAHTAGPETEYDPAAFALVSCVVAPGFEFAGFELASATDMAPAMHHHGQWVRRLLTAAIQP